MIRIIVDLPTRGLVPGGKTVNLELPDRSIGAVRRYAVGCSGRLGAKRNLTTSPFAKPAGAKRASTWDMSMAPLLAALDAAGLNVVDRRDVRPKHLRASDETDPRRAQPK